MQHNTKVLDLIVIRMLKYWYYFNHNTNLTLLIKTVDLLWACDFLSRIKYEKKYPLIADKNKAISL
jgi:hypothetical protein